VPRTVTLIHLSLTYQPKISDHILLLVIIDNCDTLGLGLKLPESVFYVFFQRKCPKGRSRLWHTISEITNGLFDVSIGPESSIDCPGTNIQMGRLSTSNISNQFDTFEIAEIGMTWNDDSKSCRRAGYARIASNQPNT